MSYCKKLEKSLVISHLFTYFATETPLKVTFWSC